MPLDCWCLAEKAGLGTAAAKVEHEMRLDRDPEATCAQARSGLPYRTREAESRRLQAVQEAVQESGWAPRFPEP